MITLRNPSADTHTHTPLESQIQYLVIWSHQLTTGCFLGRHLKNMAIQMKSLYTNFVTV